MRFVPSAKGLNIFQHVAVRSTSPGAAAVEDIAGGDFAPPGCFMLKAIDS